MASLIDYQSPDPRIVRGVLASTFDEYARGEVMLPRRRLTVPAFALPRRSQHHARLLENAWGEIDLDREYFRDTVDLAVEGSLHLARTQGESAQLIVATKVGRNATYLARVTASPQEDTPPATGFVRLHNHEFRSLVDGGVFPGIRIDNDGGVVPTGPSGLILDTDFDRASYLVTTRQ